MQSIAEHFDAHEWARGPSQSCRRLNKLPLTRLAIQEVGPASLSAAHPPFQEAHTAAGSDSYLTFVHSVQVMALNEETFGAQCQTVGAMVTQRFASGLRWAAERTSAATRSLVIQCALAEALIGAAAVNPLVAAISGGAHLSNLRSLAFMAYPFEEGGNDLTLVGLLDWLLEHAPDVKTAFLRVRSRHLPASHISFRLMRLLIMPAHGFQSHLLVASSCLPWKF